MEKRVNHPVKNRIAKVPVVMQMEALECGAACLCMVLAYYRKWLPLEEVRKTCGVSRDGSNAANMVKAAKRYGLKAKGYRMEPEVLMEEGTFPCIIHWNLNHFVVCNGFKGKKAYLNDPARGSVAVSLEEFDKSFSGIVLFFEPTEKFEPEGKPVSILSFAKKQLKGAGVAVTFTVLMMVISSMIQIINPAFSRVFIDRLLTGNNPTWATSFFVFLALYALILVAVSWEASTASYKIDGKMASYGTTSFMWKILHMPMEFFSQRMAGDIQMRMEENAEIALDMVETFAPLAINSFMMVFYLVVMIRYSLVLAIVGMTSVIINAYVSTIISRKRINITRASMKNEGKFASFTTSGISMIETIKSSGAEAGFFRKWAGYQADVNTDDVENEKISSTYGIIPTIVSSLSSVVMLFLGVYMAMFGNFTVGMIVAFQGFMESFTSPALTLASAGQTIMEMRVQMERVQDVMDYPDDVIYHYSEEEETFSKLSGAVEMKDISFGYSPLAAPFIKNFNLNIKQGQSIAIVGSSGSGKSTIAKLISGLYQPWSGEILMDGRPLSEIDRDVFTGSVAVVDQEIVLFEDTIAENIKMWDKSIESFEVIMAARDAQIHDDIMQRNGGYSYKITENGRDLSGGQRQRLEIARVLAQDPTLIIMDEATSALDAQTEYDVVQAIKNRGITCIIVAHRLSTIRDCDEIIVMKDGEIIERGKHQDLYEKNGYYKELVAMN